MKRMFHQYLLGTLFFLTDNFPWLAKIQASSTSIRNFHIALTEVLHLGLILLSDLPSILEAPINWLFLNDTII